MILRLLSAMKLTEFVGVCEQVSIKLGKAGIFASLPKDRETRSMGDLCFDPFPVSLSYLI